MMDLITKHDDMDVEIVCSIGSAHSQTSSLSSMDSKSYTTADKLN